MQHRPTWNGGRGNADIWLIENLVCASNFHVNNTANITTPPAFNKFNASNCAHVADQVDIILVGYAPSLLHDGKTDLLIILKNRLKIRCKLACKVVHKRSIFDFNSTV